MNTEVQEIASRRIRQLQIIVAQLVVGVLFFVGTVVMLHALKGFRINSEIGRYIEWGSIALLGIVAVLQFVVPSLIDRAGRKKIDPTTDDLTLWAPTFMIRTIIGCALLEAACFLGGVGSLISGESTGLIVAGVGAAMMIVSHFPTTDKFSRYVERQQELAMNEKNSLS